MRHPTYVVATDLSSHSRRAAEVAARLAARTRATLDCFCAIPASVVDAYGIDVARSRLSVEALARRCAADARRAATAHVAIARDVPSAILRHAERSGAALLVVAPHGATGWKRALLGSVTEKVLRRASGSVLVARAAGASPWKRILAGVDRNPGAESTLRHAIALARALGAELDVVHVVRPAELLLPRSGPVSRGPGGDAERLKEKAREFEEWVASFPARGVRLRARVLEGSPAEVLVGEARRSRADVVVVRAGDTSPLRRVVLGSVSYAVAAVSPVSVLVVREPRTAAR